MQILVVIILALLMVTAITGQEMRYQANPTMSVLADSLAPESSLYNGRTSINSETNMSMESRRLASVEQSLVEVCRSTYYMGKANNCLPLNENFTWKFLLQNGVSGSLNSILNLASSGTFSCSTPEKYGVHLMVSTYGAGGLSGYNYNLNIYNSSTHTLQTIGGQPDPCAYADIVQ